MLTRLDDLFWTIQLRIPDNSEARSAKGFKFKRGLDALTYGWELVGQVFELAVATVQSALTGESTGANHT